MATEKFQNGAAVTTLSGSITNSQTTLVVASASGFPASGNFRIRIGNEIMLVTGVSGTTFTVTRGAEGTASDAQTSGVNVNYYLTAESLEQAFADVITVGPWASRPSGEFAGQMYIATDSPYVSRYNGSAWEVFGLMGVHKMSFSGFAQVNGGTLTSTGHLKLSCPAGVTDNIRMYVRSIPSTPFTMVARLNWAGLPADYFSAGLCWRDSASSKIICHGMLQTAAAAKFHSQKFTNETTYSADYGVFSTVPKVRDFVLPMNWMRLEDNGTNRIWSISTNGRDWVVMHTIGRTDFLTANQFGFYVKASNNAVGVVTCDYMDIF